MPLFKAWLDLEQKVVAVTQASNTLGTINDVKTICQWAHAVGALCLVDAAQSVVAMPLDVQSMGCDFLCFSAHKLFGPYGVGVVYAETIPGILCLPYQLGGKHDWSRGLQKSSTWMLLIVLRRALQIFLGDWIRYCHQYVQKLSWAEIQTHENQLLSEATTALKQIQGLTIHGQATRKQPWFLFLLMDAILQILDKCWIRKELPCVWVIIALNHWWNVWALLEPYELLFQFIITSQMWKSLWKTSKVVRMLRWAIKKQNSLEVDVRVQSTPNPNAWKFILDRPVMLEGKATFSTEEECFGNRLAIELYKLVSEASPFLVMWSQSRIVLMQMWNKWWVMPSPLFKLACLCMIHISLCNLQKDSRKDLPQELQDIEEIFGSHHSTRSSKVMVAMWKSFALKTNINCMWPTRVPVEPAQAQPPGLWWPSKVSCAKTIQRVEVIPLWSGSAALSEPCYSSYLICIWFLEPYSWKKRSGEMQIKNLGKWIFCSCSFGFSPVLQAATSLPRYGRVFFGYSFASSLMTAKAALNPFPRTFPINIDESFFNWANDGPSSNEIARGRSPMNNGLFWIFRFGMIPAANWAISLTFKPRTSWSGASHPGWLFKSKSQSGSPWLSRDLPSPLFTTALIYPILILQRCLIWDERQLIWGFSPVKSLHRGLRGWSLTYWNYGLKAQSILDSLAWPSAITKIRMNFVLNISLKGGIYEGIIQTILAVTFYRLLLGLSAITDGEKTCPYQRNAGILASQLPKWNCCHSTNQPSNNLSLSS